MSRVTNIGRTFLIAGAAVLLLCASGADATDATAKGKPMIPVQVSIEPTAANLKAQNIKPGDVVELRIAARAVRGPEDMAVEITLLDGAELVSGDLGWSGRLSRNDVKQLVVSVRAPAKGTGRVMANVTVLRDGQGVMAKQAVYTLGAEDLSGKGMPARGTRKDSKGRSVVEY